MDKHNAVYKLEQRIFQAYARLMHSISMVLGGDQGEKWFGSGAEGFFLGVFIFLGLIWLFYFIIIKAVRFVVRGFMDKD